jgi:hypothetical protein
MSEDQKLQDALTDARREANRKLKEFERNHSQEQLDEMASRIITDVTVVKVGSA